MLTSQAREILRGVETVIVDEVHAVAGSKRGAHLSVSLERLDALLDTPAQRVGLSATVRPLDEVARFLGGHAPVDIVSPPAEKAWDLKVVVPVEDMTAPDGDAPYDVDRDAADADDGRSGSIWPHVEEHVADLIEQHRSTIVFANSRRLAERLTARLNEIATNEGRRRPPGGRQATGPDHGPVRASAGAGAEVRSSPRPTTARSPRSSARSSRTTSNAAGSPAWSPPAASSSASTWAPSTSSSRSSRHRAWPAPCSAWAGPATRSVRSPTACSSPSIAATWPRPPSRSSGCAVARIESMRVPANPLDVLAQQVVATTALEAWTVDDLYDLLRRSAPFANLPRSAFEATLDLLSGRYPSDEFAELRPRVVWDRVGGTITGRPGAQRLAVTSGGTIPDRGLFGVFLVGEGTGRRVGELDEEMVYESRVGDVFALGATSWRIEDITHDRVLVTPAPGVPGRLPFWKGDTLGRPAELGEAIGGFTRELAALPGPSRRTRGRPRRVSTRTPPTTWSPTSTSRSRRPASCPATARCWSSGSVTSSATGGWSSTPPTAPPSTRLGRWPSTPGSASATASTARRWPPTTAS